MNQLFPQEPIVANPLQPMLDLNSSLIVSAQAIEKFIGKQPNPYSQERRMLRRKEQAIINYGTALSNLAMQESTQGITDAVGHLKSNIDSVNTTIQEIGNVTKVINIASALLTVAAGIASGGALAAVQAIPGLAAAVSSARTS